MPNPSRFAVRKLEPGRGKPNPNGLRHNLVIWSLAGLLVPVAIAFVRVIFKLFLVHQPADIIKGTTIG